MSIQDQLVDPLFGSLYAKYKEVVPEKSRLGRFVGGVAEDIEPLLPYAQFAMASPQEQGARAANFLLSEQPDAVPQQQQAMVPATDPNRADVRGNQHPRQHELDEREQQAKIEAEAAERQAMARQGFTSYGPGVFAKGQGVGSGRGTFSAMQSSGTPAAEALEQRGRQEELYANRQKQQLELSRLSPVEQARLQAASRYRPDPVMQMFQTGMAVAQRYSRDIEAINGMQGLSDQQRAAALENLNGQYEPYFRVLGLSRGVGVPAFGGYGPGQE
jgi:hypothetical protein